MSIYLVRVRNIAATNTHGYQHSVTIFNGMSLKHAERATGDWNKRVIVPTSQRASNPWVQAVIDAVSKLSEFPVTENDVSYMGDTDTHKSESFYLVDAL